MNPALAFEVDDAQPLPIYVHADPSGIVYDRRTNALFVADAAGGGVLRVAGGRVDRVAMIDGEVDGVVTPTQLASLTRSPDHTLYVTRHDDPSVFQIDPDGRSHALIGLDERWSRNAIAYDRVTHGLYATRHLRDRSGAGYGEVTRIDLATHREETIAVGFLRPTGIAVLGETLVVADRRLCGVYRIELVDGQATYCAALATPIGRPHSVCTFDRDSVIVTAYDDKLKFGTVRRLWLDGNARLIACGAWHPRGVTTDGDRAYVSIRHGRRVMVFPIPKD
ncbi:MAG: hypothetical protein H0T79_11260 [Deltaproteobacteria bacterium]|nr:hypothetical protein [Deltaproteobacteria bacterium]